ncbi:prepilin-type N-terminal cleavage/methylation domain-containing protein [Paucibacter sp. APW11]|uniref:Prepilin-type N-terminal cleavage/methylation domain-containing protein n=1 Tax=Roseateles aquae TaxID=3077235 RepID=A0ABU3P9U5_9BURK|nr:prepilin-type N-terminal cleavage/methylation domain-containing protein [Paucibacter sp. APW11]MDT8999346.1 prepilin-type N-terminal cleavage/methylation domain-containing protein [Paucibacter sp. APW11]
MNPARPRGFTLLEVAFVLAVLGIVLAIAVPGYAHLSARAKLRSAAEALASDLRNARLLSVQERVPVFVSFHSGAQWCWGVSRTQACECETGKPRCDVSSASYKSHPDVLLQAGSDSEFEPGLGRAMRWSQVGMSNSKNQQLHVDLNAMGRPQICGPAAPRSSDC